MKLRYLTIGLALACAFGTLHAQTTGKADKFNPYTCLLYTSDAADE